MRRGIPGERSIDEPHPDVAVLLKELSPYVRQSGDNWRKRWIMQDRKLLDYLLVYIADGHGLFRVGGDEFKVKARNLIWIPPDTVHFMQGLSADLHCLYIHFDLVYDPARSHWDACIPEGVLDLTDFADIMHPKLALPIVNDLCGLVPVSNPAAVHSLLSKICFEHQRSFNQSMLMLSGMTLQLLELIFQAKLTINNTEKDCAMIQKLQQASSFIQENAGRELDVTRLAKRFAFSESHFRKLFREFHGSSPKRMHCRARIRKACEMLVYTDLTVSEIADNLGYSTVHNFSRAFKDTTTVSPSDFRKGPTDAVERE